MDATVEVILFLALVGLSAAFSGMETALVTLSDVKLRRRTEEPKAPKMLVRWRDTPNDVLATLLIGNNIVNITSSALATDFTDRMLEGTSAAGFGIPIAVGVTTMLVLIIGEVVPKTFAKHNPERYLVVLPIVSATYWLFYPLMRVLVRLTRSVVEGLGGDIHAREQVTEEDIEELVRMGRVEGSMSPEAAKLLSGIFELTDKIAREVMVPRTEVRALDIDATTDEILEMFSSSGYSRYPVYEDSIDNIVGVLYVKDYFSAALEKGRQDGPKVAEVMRKPMVRPWNIPVQDLLAEMQRERVHMAIIASEYGGVAGVLTLEDIVEEVFGPIYDEHDRGLEAIHLEADGGFIVDGVLTISDLELALDLDFPEDEDYETVTGLLMKEAGRMPEAGFSCVFEGFRFTVLSADATRVLKVGIKRLPPPSEDEDAAGEGGDTQRKAASG